MKHQIQNMTNKLVALFLTDLICGKSIPANILKANIKN